MCRLVPGQQDQVQRSHMPPTCVGRAYSQTLQGHDRRGLFESCLKTESQRLKTDQRIKVNSARHTRTHKCGYTLSHNPRCPTRHTPPPPPPPDLPAALVEAALTSRTAPLHALWAQSSLAGCAQDVLGESHCLP